MVSKLKVIALAFVSTLIFSMNTQAQAQANDTNMQAVVSACENITPEQRQMAKVAGYDVDSLCSAANDATNSTIDTTTPQVVIPTETVTPTTDNALEILLSSFDDTDENGLGELGEFDEMEETEELELQQFGYDLFEGTPTTFAPATEIPVVSNYMIGPGDSIKVQLFGKISESYTLTVSRDGTVQFPELGPISLAGLTFNEMKELLSERIQKQMIGVQSSITLGELRSIRIFILGDAIRPGSYTVSSLSSMTNALFVSGGVRKIGSLRNIQLKRQGKIVTTLDLYDLLLKGDTSGDVRLLPGDVIFIPPIGKTAGISGEIKRPAIYEIKGEKSIEKLVSLAGGYLPSAYPKASRIERINTNGDRTLIDVDLKSKAGADINISNGDVLQIYPVLEKMENIVLIEGHVYRPGGFAFRKGMKISDLVGSVNNLLPSPDLDYALLIREKQITRDIEVMQVNLRAIFSDSSSFNNITLQSKDKLIVFAASDPREEIITPIIDKLRLQEKIEEPSKIVTVSGSIKFAGDYPLTKGMSVRELVYAGGGLKESTYVSSAEITRKDYSNSEQASVKHFSFALKESLGKDTTNLHLLQAGDHLTLKLIPRHQERLTIQLDGEIKFPGTYEFTLGETLSDIISRAGGLTELAHVEASFFSRESLKTKEAKQISEFQEKLKADIAAAQLEDVNSNKSMNVDTLNTLLDNLENSKVTGRLVINLAAIIQHSIEDVQLRDGDMLIVPTYRQEITLIGEVQNPTSHLFNPTNDHDDYISQSGGITEQADVDRIYVIKANGSVFLPDKPGWFHDEVIMSPGDTIVVPVETDRLDNLTFWTSVSQIIYQMALGAAAVKAL